MAVEPRRVYDAVGLAAFSRGPPEVRLSRLALALALAAPLPALAQADVLPEQLAERPSTYKPVTELDFGDRRVEANTV